MVEDSEKTDGLLRQHKRHFLSELLESMRPYLKSLAREHAKSIPECKEDESDIVQRSILKAIQKADQFHGTSSGQWRNWISTIVRNQARDIRRYWSNERRTSSQEDGNSINQLVDNHSNEPKEALMNDERRIKLRMALSRLRGEERQLVQWRLVQHMTHKEIALRLNTTIPTARRRCESAVNALRWAWHEIGADSDVPVKH